MAAYPGGPPDTLNERHKRVAEMEAAGASDREISERLGLSVNRISILRTSPLYQALILDLSKETRSKSTFDIARWFDDQAEPTSRRLVELRDQDDNPSVALGATNAILDRVAPKRTAVDVDTTVHLRISVEERDRIQRALVEDDAIDADADFVDSKPGLPGSASGLKPLDVAIDEAAAREAAVEAADAPEAP